MKKDGTIMAKKQRKIGAPSSYIQATCRWPRMDNWCSVEAIYNKVHGYLMYTVLYTICAKYLRNITIILFTRYLQTTHKNNVKIHVSTVKL